MDYLVYLREVFGEERVFAEEKTYPQLPLYIIENYTVDSILLAGKEYVFITPNKERTSSDTLEKHAELIGGMVSAYPVLVLSGLRRQKRNILLQKHIPFVDPGRQIFIPYIYLDIREQNTVSLTVTEEFSPSTQLIYIYLLLFYQEIIDTALLAKNLKVSRMTVSRALRELTSIGVVKETGANTRKKYRVIEKHKYWELGKPYLINPVSKAFLAKTIPESVTVYNSSLTALASLSMISNQTQKNYAINKKDVVKFRDYVIDDDGDEMYNNPMKIEVWKYDPGLLADKQNNVDIYSLFAIFRNESDPRIEIEMEKTLEEALA